MSFPRPCIKCGALTSGASYCDAHKPKRRRRDTPQLAEKKRFLYGGNYKAKAKALKAAGGTCHLCGGGGDPGDPWEADHINPELGHRSQLRLAHRSCNQRRGNKPLT
jgi:5-methylcytosine-specific restriction endonuclease McrA